MDNSTTTTDNNIDNTIGMMTSTDMTTLFQFFDQHQHGTTKPEQCQLQLKQFAIAIKKANDKLQIDKQQFEFQQQQFGIEKQQFVFEKQQFTAEKMKIQEGIESERKQMENDKQQFIQQYINNSTLTDTVSSVLINNESILSQPPSSLSPLSHSTSSQSTILSPEQLLQYTQEFEQSKIETLQQFDGFVQRIEYDTLRCNADLKQRIHEMNQCIHDMNQREVKINKLQRRLIKFSQELIQRENDIDNRLEEREKGLLQRENDVEAQEELIIFAQETKQVQKKQLDIDFTRNKTNTPTQSHLAIKFDLLPLNKVFNFGGAGWGSFTIFRLLYNNLFENFFKIDHDAGKTPTKTSHHKIFISSKDVLNGDWFQVCSDGAEIDINTIQVGQFVDFNTRHPAKHAIDQSDYNYGNNSYNYTLRIKWE